VGSALSGVEEFAVATCGGADASGIFYFEFGIGLQNVSTCCNYRIGLQSVCKRCSMPQTVSRSRESTLNLRVDGALKAEFAAVVEEENRPAAEVLRSLMSGYVEAARRRRFAAEARRQSELIAASEDEAEVMRWIQDVSALESER
jgi:hypothetical protein